MSSKISATMAAAITETEDHGGELVVWEGGWWTYPSCPVQRTTPDGLRVPRWYIGTNTVRALIARGYMIVTEYSTTGFPIRVRLSLPADE